jgi:2-keto-4-pentenoate hydratase/2-oxohepta-3-ene-1,7-dioic acid hydratase in catechol pathway
MFTRTAFGWLALFSILLGSGLVRAAEPQKFCRFQKGDKVAFGLVEGEEVRELSGSLFGDWKKSETKHALKDVTLLVPSQPTQVLALAGNYKSHLQDTEIPAKFKIPQPFFKSPSSLAAQGANIVLPKDAGPTHYEAELVIVIGKRAKKVSKEMALDYVFGVTAGNDISERYWQNDEENKDVQWWRAKGSDTFGPCGPFILRGANYDDLKLTLRQNGQVKQEERTSYMIHDVASTVSFISQYITLHPGDLIFTGTPGKTEEIKAGDVLEVELEGVGVFRSKVAREE